MMQSVVAWAERRARIQARQRAGQIAERMRAILRGASVEATETGVIVSGRGLVRRWLIDPELRFLARDGL